MSCRRPGQPQRPAGQRTADRGSPAPSRR
jgi:hypothetical protein